MQYLTDLRTRILRESFAIPVDIFRILVGILSCAYFVTLICEIPDFSGSDGLLDHQLLRKIFWFTQWSLFFGSPDTWVFYTLFGFGCIGSIAIILGVRVKSFTFLMFIIEVSTYRWNFVVMNVEDAVMHLLLFWLLLLPVGHTLVFGEWLRDRANCMARWRRITVPGLPLRCFLGNICLIYLVAGLWKFTSPLWQEGAALYCILRMPMAIVPEFWNSTLYPYLKIANHLGMILEAFLPVILFFRYRNRFCKWLALLGMLGFHLGIICTLRIPFANLAMLGTVVLFFRDDIAKWLNLQNDNLIHIRSNFHQVINRTLGVTPALLHFYFNGCILIL